MKILEIATEVPPYKGGISRIVGILSNQLKLRGHKVDTLAPKFRFREFKLSTIPFRRYDDYDIIHLHGPTPFLSDLTLLFNSRTPIVYTHHAEVSWSVSEELSRIYRKFHRFLLKRAKAVIVTSWDYAHLFDGFNVFLIRIPCPLEPPINFSIEKKEENPFTVLFVGQFRPYKGVDLLLRAANILNNVKFILVGEGYLKPKLMHKAKSLKNVDFRSAPTDEDLKRLYKSAHVICLPSINTSEAWGIVLTEGALYGCLPVASNLPGVRENISLLKGLIFERGSYVALATIIKHLSEDKTLWLNLAKKSQEAAYKYVNVYTPEYYALKHEEVFKKCL
jgi:glycosyltransferase involved in cell wall biosynthesis